MIDLPRVTINQARQIQAALGLLTISEVIIIAIDRMFRVEIGDMPAADEAPEDEQAANPHRMG